MKRRNFLNNAATISGGFFLTRISSFSDPGISSDNLDTLVSSDFSFSNDLIYLNTAGIGAVPKPVLDKVESSMREDQLYPKPGHDLGKWNEIKDKFAAFLGRNVKQNEIALIGCAAEGINVILNGLDLQEGDEIITSTHEHPALHIPLLNKVKNIGIALKTFEPDRQDALNNVQKIKELITDKTKLIFISHVTCTTGQIFPIREIGKLAGKNNILFALDGAQAAGSVHVNPAMDSVDFYTFSGHKWLLGPKRTGLLRVKEDLLDRLQPTTVGAYSDAGYDILKKEIKFQKSAQKFEYGTVNHSLYEGLEEALGFINSMGIKEIIKHNKTLSEKFYSGLKDIPNTEIISPEEEKYRSSIISFKLKNKDHTETANHLMRKGMRVRVVNEVGLNAVRASFHIYNNEDHVEKTLNEIELFAKS